jgi:hypothetical protein
MARQYYDYKTGLGNVGSYQASGRPYLSSSIHLSSSNSVVKVEFPSVSRFVTIKNEGPAASNEVQFRVGFSQNGVNAVENTNYLLLDNQESFSADYRVTAVYLRVDPTGATTNATASVIAGLTSIAGEELTHNWTGSVGVG